MCDTHAHACARVRTQVAWEEWDKRGIATRYYNEGMHSAAFALPQYLESALQGQDYQ